VRDPRSIGAVLVLFALQAGCGGDEGEGVDRTSVAPTPTREQPSPPDESTERATEPSNGEAEREGARRPEASAQPGRPPGPSSRDRAEAAEAAEAAYIAYVDAINARDGEALCALLPANAERELRPPVEGGSCAARLGGSIGYADPRGYPVWERTIFNGVESVSVGADTSTARITAAILTEFEDRGEPSVESDIAYLESRGGEWRLAKPTGALYRAIGRPELPPTVIAPP